MSVHRLKLREFALEYDAAVADALDVEVNLISSHTHRMEKGYFRYSNNNPEYFEEF